MNEVPQVEQRADPPPGNVPKNRQTWIMLAVAAVIVLAVVFSGSATPKPKVVAGAVPPAASATPRAEIERYTQALRVDEERLRASQAAASQAEEVFRAQTPVTGMQGAIPGQGLPVTGGVPAYYAAANTPSPQPEKSKVEEDREKREYASVFASSIALSFRKPLAESVREADQETAVPPPAKPSAPAPAAPPAKSRPQHVLLEGTIIEAVLTNRLEGSFAGPVNCQVTTDVYSHNRQHLLIPRGTRVLGAAKKVSDQDQERLAIVFHRLLIFNRDQSGAYSVSLDDDTPGLDQAGATGVKDKVNHHYLSTFGTSIALGLLAGFSMYGTRGVYTADAEDMFRQGVASSLSRDATHILSRKLNRLPDITIREGTRMRILLAGDLSLPAYNEHQPQPGL